MSGRESRDVVDLVASSEYSREAEEDEAEVVAVAAPASPDVREVGAPGARRKRPRPEGPAALDAQLAQQLHEELNGAPAAPRAGGERLWHAEAQTLSGDLAPLLRQRVSGAAGEVRLCDGPLFYLAQQDKWSCGYRCLQMVIAALRHGSAAHDAALCFPGLGPKSVPDVRSLQLGVDLAHLAGIDPEGFVEIGLLEGGRGWLGATDACALLRHHGIRSEVFAFSGARAGANVLELLAAFLDMPSSATQRWERVCAMMRVPPGRARLRAGPPAAEGPSFPVFLQYQGHAVLVVGVCGAAGAPADALVVLDPAERRFEDKLRAGAGGPRLARITTDALARRQEYELLIVHHSEFFCTSTERELAKTVGIAPVKSD